RSDHLPLTVDLRLTRSAELAVTRTLGRDMDTSLLRAIQHYNARAAIGSSSMRGAGSAGVMRCARAFLGEMPLRPFGTSSKSRFLSRLDSATHDLKRALPKEAQRWGLARKGLNIFLRN